MATRPARAALWGVTTSLKKLAAGSGYEYLTEQVAAYDSTELGRTPLADYYAAKGEAPGRWLGSGLVGIDGLRPGEVVSAEQMKNLFGEGCHPVTGAAHGRRFGEGSVAGFELTFSPAKSVSTLWAIAPPEIAAQIRTAHDAAVADALDFLETHAIFTREGAGGARQVETRGLVATAFIHRDSRAGDPDRHTHVAVANKVQTAQGKWLAVYGTVVHEHVVAASEAYNTALEFHLRENLGVRFVDAPRPGGKRGVRELVELIDDAERGVLNAPSPPRPPGSQHQRRVQLLDAEAPGKVHRTISESRVRVRPTGGGHTHKTPADTTSGPSTMSGRRGPVNARFLRLRARRTYSLRVVANRRQSSPKRCHWRRPRGLER